jgi:hypothetical protein
MVIKGSEMEDCRRIWLLTENGGLVKRDLTPIILNGKWAGSSVRDVYEGKERESESVCMCERVLVPRKEGQVLDRL